MKMSGAFEMTYKLNRLDNMTHETFVIDIIITLR